MTNPPAWATTNPILVKNNRASSPPAPDNDIRIVDV
jgi:hypothetical protein